MFAKKQNRFNYIHKISQQLVETERLHLSSSTSSIRAAISEERGSQWEALMRKFSDDHKEECTAVAVDIPRAERDIKVFPTGSMYRGSWDVLGMSGRGTYNFPNGVIYEGDFEDGMFHGNGELRYPSGIIVKGQWNKGTLANRSLLFADGIRYDDKDWDYCKMPDRRFSVEFDYGLQPAGRAFLTAEQPTRDIPPGQYDAGDGFYDPKTKAVYSTTDSTAIVRAPAKTAQAWIVQNCRSYDDEPLGARIDLYEEWPEPALDPAELARKASTASCASGWKFPVDDDEERWQRFSGQSVSRPPGMSTTSFRSTTDVQFGARQPKLKFQWGNY